MPVKDRILTWLQIIGNFGVILGLVLVAIQIQQNSDLSRVSLAHDAWLQSADSSIALMGENPAAVLAKVWTSDAPLSDEELVVADRYFHSVGEALKRIEYTQGAGLELYSTEASAQLFARAFSSGFGRAWWAMNRESIAQDAPVTRDRVDVLLAEGVGDTGDYYVELRGLLGR